MVGASFPVTYTGILPDLFSEGEAMVGTGPWSTAPFVATEILGAPRGSTCPAEVIEALRRRASTAT